MNPIPILRATSLLWHSFVILISAFVISAPAAVPQLINHQGRIAVNGTNFEGAGQFKFALVNTTGSTTYWSNDNTSTAGSEPTAAVSLPVVKGLYSVLLGDTGMTALPATVFDSADVRLRVWFNDGTLGFQQITPDQRLVSAPYALNAAKAESIPDASITSAKLASDLTLPGTTTGTFSGSLTGSFSGNGSALTTLNATSLTTGTLGDARLSTNVALLDRAAQNFTGTTNSFSGNIGIGTTSPSTRLQVFHSGFGMPNTSGSTQSAGQMIRLRDGGSVVLDIGADGGSGYWFQTSLQGNLSNTFPLLLNPVGGNVGIGMGIGSGPVTKLDIKGTGSALPATTGADQSAGHIVRLRDSGSNVLDIGSAGSSGIWLQPTSFGNVSNTFPLLLNPNGGNVGIGVTAASARLHVGGNARFNSTVTLSAGTTTIAPLVLQSGTNLTTPVFGSVEFDGTNLYLTNNSGTPTRKTLAFTDSAISGSQIANGTITSAMLASNLTLAGTTTGTFSGNGSALTNLSGGNIAAGTIIASALASGSVNSSKIVDGTIVNADINGSATIADTKLATISTAGKVANSATTGTASNTPSTLVLRDASGNFAAGTITGTFVGDGSGLTGVGSTEVLLADVKAPPIRPVVAWGDNDDGQTSVPTTLINANTAAIAAGGSVGVALLKTGTVEQWGAGTPVPGGLVNVTHIAAGTDHRLARKSDGTVIAWGDNTFGQSSVPGGLTTATNVAAGEKHSLALRADGTVIAWGDNSFTQTTVPGTATNVTAIAAGYDHSLALKADGTVIAWGRDDSGQVSGTTAIVDIPDGTHVVLSRSLPAATNTLTYGGSTTRSTTSNGTNTVTMSSTAGLTVGMTVTGPGIITPAGLTNIVAIAAGAYHSLAVKSDGTVVAWGWDTGGQVAGATGLTDISKVAGGYAFSLALKNDGTLIAWGDNTDGQTIIPAAAVNVTAIAAGPSHALALRADLIPAQVARLDQDNVFTGKVGIQRAPAANNLEVEGQASKTTAGNWLANSDRRIKDNIKPITGALEKLSHVRLVDFNYTADYIAAHPGIEDKRYLNVIAQEFAEVFPEDVKSSGETLPDGSPILQVDTYPLTIYSAAAVQELAKENAALKKQLADQETRLKKLEALIK